MPKWLTAVGKWAAKALINAGREQIEKIVDEKKKSARTVARTTPSKSSE